VTREGSHQNPVKKKEVPPIVLAEGGIVVFTCPALCADVRKKEPSQPAEVINCFSPRRGKGKVAFTAKVLIAEEKGGRLVSPEGEEKKKMDRAVLGEV